MPIITLYGHLHTELQGEVFMGNLRAGGYFRLEPGVTHVNSSDGDDTAATAGINAGGELHGRLGNRLDLVITAGIGARGGQKKIENAYSEPITSQDNGWTGESPSTPQFANNTDYTNATFGQGHFDFSLGLAVWSPNNRFAVMPKFVLRGTLPDVDGRYVPLTVTENGQTNTLNGLSDGRGSVEAGGELILSGQIAKIDNNAALFLDGGLRLTGRDSWFANGGAGEAIFKVSGGVDAAGVVGLTIRGTRADAPSRPTHTSRTTTRTDRATERDDGIIRHTGDGNHPLDQLLRNLQSSKLGNEDCLDFTAVRIDEFEDGSHKVWMSSDMYSSFSGDQLLYQAGECPDPVATTK